ncbi:prolyl oligopeptidase family serine peptidase [Oerskovia sp. Sa1BUA8]|uniref:Prolyl oligopeptidase family serine peptidase n=1 Tax=Oerskovia douganii TaxID=2762210 RepID=A0A9D5UCC6_9CELL|nr:prolyl oligopeptidase family serine peptidase [Oerskovia douganii]MBE7701930.1 prolyl oligopeptidase family serine peptidase [Oerskovia douganii]
MIFRTAATSAALAIGLALVGAVTGPQWSPVPVTDHLSPTAADTAIGGQGQDVQPVGTYEVKETEVVVRLEGTSVDGLLREPVGAPDGLPGVVFLHGAGTGAADEAFVEVATDMASAGIVTLVPSKRLDTYTTRHRDYVDMADDYQRSVELLRTRPSVDPERVGLYAESEGTWIAPVLVDQDPDVSFLVMVSAPVVPPRQQAGFAVDSYLRNTGVPQGVFRAIPRAVGMEMPGGGFEYADFDVTPYLERLDVPTLVVYGTADPSMPIEQGALQIIADAGANGNHDVTVRYYAGANHGIRVGGSLVPDFARDVSAWVQGLPGTAGAEPAVAGAQPDQLYLASAVPNPRWYGNGDIVIGFVIVGGALLVVGPLVWLVTGLVRRVRRTSRPAGRLAPGLRWPLVGLAVGSVATMVGLVVYLVSVARLALDYQTDAWVVQGGWIAVRLLGLATVVAAAFIINRLADLRTAHKAVAASPEGGVVVRPATGVGARATLWATVAGSTILLVTLAYWGVYQLGI